MGLGLVPPTWSPRLRHSSRRPTLRAHANLHWGSVDLERGRQIHGSRKGPPAYEAMCRLIWRQRAPMSQGNGTR
eukprot:4978431-Pyramimonas_sp.AAC.1